jgi:hypothetical protein
MTSSFFYTKFSERFPTDCEIIRKLEHERKEEEQESDEEDAKAEGERGGWGILLFLKITKNK